MDRNRALLIAACGVLGVGSIAFGVHRYQAAVARRESIQKADNLFSAKKCIAAHSRKTSKTFAGECDRVDLELLPEEVQPDFSAALAKNEAIRAEEEAKVKAEAEKRRKWQAAQAKKVADEKAAAEAKFKAEGWWEQEPGIFIRWCDGKNPWCPGPKGNGYSDYTTRAMVWCKERACGDIYARLNIERNGVVVGWTNDTSYGGYGQKVVLTFGSSIRGSGRLVEFIVR